MPTMDKTSGYGAAHDNRRAEACPSVRWSCQAGTCFLRDLGSCFVGRSGRTTAALLRLDDGASGFHPRRFSSPPPLALCQSLKHKDRLLDVRSFRSQFRKDLVDVHRYIMARQKPSPDRWPGSASRLDAQAAGYGPAPSAAAASRWTSSSVSDNLWIVADRF